MHDNIQILRAFNLFGLEYEDNILGVIVDGVRIPLTLERARQNGRFLK
ncbi:MAG: hypothetical protein H6731_06160 [Myxococcales bacterium]|nr:MAG: hypothetical protein H6731_06160 [Myxococcales bacterium]